MIVFGKSMLAVVVAGVAITALTGYGSHLFSDHLSGWGLLAHMAAAPLVLFGFAAVALLWGRRHRFDADNGVAGGTKLLFWIMLVCALASAALMLAAMLPVFGYIGQDWLRIITLSFIRGPEVSADVYPQWTDKLNPLFPTGDPELDAALLELLIFLQAPDVEAKGLARLEHALTREEQITYAVSLRAGRNWTESSRKQFFRWLASTRAWRGGRTYGLVLERIGKDALMATPDAIRSDMQGILEAGPTEPAPPLMLQAGRGLVKEWTVEELVRLVEQDTSERNLERGRKMFAAVGCFACHRVAGEGGILGPDLTAVSGHLGVRDLIEAVVEPSKAISDQYGTATVTMLSGERLTGRIVNLTEDQLHLAENLYTPADVRRIAVAEVASVEPSKVSLMPKGMINFLEAGEILDMLAWLRSGRGQ